MRLQINVSDAVKSIHCWPAWAEAPTTGQLFECWAVNEVFLRRTLESAGRNLKMITVLMARVPQIDSEMSGWIVEKSAAATP